MGHPTSPQMSCLNPPESYWCERMQDMSGYILLDSTLPPSAEHFNFSNSTIHHESDLDLQNSGYPSPEEVIVEDQADAVLEEDADMFNNSNYSLLDTKLKTWLPSTSEMDEFERTRDFVPVMDSDNSYLFVGTVKEDKKLTATSKKSSNLSIFKYEEPHIKEDPDSMLYCCTDSKLIYRDEMEIAAEEVVITEEEDTPKEQLCEINAPPNLNNLWLSSAELNQPVVPKVEVTKNAKSFDFSSSPLSSFSVIENCDPLMYSVGNMQDVDDWVLNCDNSLTSPAPRAVPPLRLDIEKARLSANQLFGGILPDTPEVLGPVLKPESEFDLVNFLLATGDSNNNPIVSSSSSKQPTVTTPRERRRGKGILSLQELKASQSPRKRPSVETVVKEEESSPPPASDIFCDRLTSNSPPQTSTVFSPTGRPMRESAARLNKRFQQEYLTSPVTSDDEDSCLSSRSKRRRTSSYNRTRLNSDSDQSAVCDSSKYRERRDRNNVSSKKSRQKRKQALEMKTHELKDLEDENVRLKKKEVELSSLLQKVLKAFQEILGSVKKEEPSEN